MAAVLGAACGFAGVSVLAKLAYEAGSSPASLLSVRVAVAGLVLTAVAVPALVGSGPRVAVRHAVAGAAGGMAFTGAGLLEFEALARLPAPTVVLLVFVAPVWVAIGSWLLWRTAIGWRRAGLIALVLGGIALLVSSPGGHRLDEAAVTMALGASFLSAGFFLLLDRLAGELGSRRASCLIALGAVTGLAVLGPHGVVDELGSAETAVYGVAIGALTALSIGLLSAGLPRTSAVSASAIIGAEPLVAALLSWLVLGELLSTVQLCGATSVVLGVVGMSVLSVRSRSRAAAGTGQRSRVSLVRRH